ncbi:MAG: tRNA pseudouridine(54/55) synthase Pus10 [Desulfurococcaceae archaeon]
MGARDIDIGAMARRAREVLTKYPLCDYCLGRLFAKAGLGLSNRERGFALKTAILLELINPGCKSLQEDLLATLARNGGEPFTRAYKKLYGRDVSVERCYICNNKLSEGYYDEMAGKVAEGLKRFEASSFLVGVRAPRDLLEREAELLAEVGFQLSESLKHEVRREVGKRVVSMGDYRVDFTHPDVVALIDLENDEVLFEVKPLYFRARYWKRGRNISHAVWLRPDGTKKYDLSIEEYVGEPLKELFEARRVVFHASGREDVDVRMLGSGRSAVIEISEPRVRNFDIELINSVLSSDLLEVRVDSIASSSDVEHVKVVESRHDKVYRALVLCKEEPKANIKDVEETFRNRVVTQRTPTRVLRRKKDVVRRRVVHELKMRELADNLYEVMVYCSSGLYVKELLNCDQGRTSPCLGDALGCNLQVLELDVLSTLASGKMI